jgi:LacI family transcriptional regulator
MSRLAMLLLLKKIKARREGREKDTKNVLVDFALVHRGSDCPPTIVEKSK